MATMQEKLATMVSGEAEEWYEEGGEGEEDWGEEDQWWDQEGEEEEDGWDDEDDWDEGEEEEIDAWGEGEDMVLQRCAMGGPNRQRNSGIHTIEVYYPQFYFKQIEMEEYDARPERYGPSVIGKYTKGVGMIEARFPTDDEDPVSFAMTVTHRLIDRMESWGFNQTALFNPEGETINAWNAFGRIDIGSESLIDRSKSMKTYVMDMFERYGDEANIEGVDMYNACYGGQAAGLAVLNWVECDRWDGRYGLAIASDISESHSSAFAFVGAACTGALYFPEAPVAHHSHRASAILHRLDFFKPIGWKSMAPVVDGKYSIDAYMTCIELCYATLRKKLNDRRVFSVTDYNVFHTGGGYHVVKKAFERMCRADDPESSFDYKQQLVQERLIPSVKLLKIIGPCHTVSSFLNMSSVIMSEWEKALGKVLLVFTYGSGCAASMYQVRFDDLAWMHPLGQWKVEFYRKAIYMPPSTQIHDVYCGTWMKFDYKPCGRELFGIDPWKYEMDVYYLMEIDKWGRRFYHRGGVLAPPLDKKFHLRVDEAEGRPRRDNYKDYSSTKPPEEKVQEKLLEDEWKKIEYEMIFEGGEDEEEVVQVAYDKANPEHRIVTVEIKTDKPGMEVLDHDGEEHTYQIVGSWSGYKEAEDMEPDDEGVFQYTVTVGENAWEDFYLLQDNKKDKKIFPAQDRSWKALPVVGPHVGGAKLKKWRIDARDLEETAEEDVGAPGDQYLVVFTWKKGSLKNLEWDKLKGEQGEFAKGKYCVAGSWTCWDFVELEDLGEGRWRLEAQMTWLGMEFVLAREADVAQLICPEVELDKEGKPKATGSSASSVLSPDARCETVQEAPRWKIDGNAGEVFRIEFFRDPDDPEELEVTWEKSGSAPVQEPPPRYFLVSQQNRWGKDGHIEMRKVGTSSSFAAELEIKGKQEPFRIVMFKRDDLAIYPDKQDCSQIQAHKVMGPTKATSDDLCWAVGKAAADKAKVGDIFTVLYDTTDKKVTWRKV